MSKNKSPETHLIQLRTTLNSATKKIRCTSSWPCKRIADCETCANRRRQYFVSMGTRYATANALDAFVTISWPLQDGEEPWGKLQRCYRQLVAGKMHRSGKYIRVLGIGEKETPHIHLILTTPAAVKLRLFARRVGPEETITQIKPTSDVRGLLGYLYDRNFLVVVRRSDRPKRMRVLSGSRGLSYGYPTRRKPTEFALANDEDSP